MKTMKRFAVFPVLLAVCTPAFAQPSNMSPHSPSADVVDVITRDAEANSQSVPVFIRSTNGENIGLGKLGKSVTFASGLSVLGDHVGRVLVMGSQEEMPDIDARSYVTSVANEHALWDRPVSQLPRYSMRGPNALGSAAATSNHSVPTCRVCGPGPEPARIGLALGGVTSHAKGQRSDGLAPLRARPGTVSSAGISSSVKRYSARTNLGNLQSSHMTSSRSFGEKRGMERQLPRVSYFNTERS